MISDTEESGARIQELGVLSFLCVSSGQYQNGLVAMCVSGRICYLLFAIQAGHDPGLRRSGGFSNDQAWGQDHLAHGGGWFFDPVQK